MTDRAELHTAVRSAMSAAFKVAVASLPTPATVDTVEAWDSLGHLLLFEELQKRLPGRIGLAAFRELMTEDDIVEYLNRH